MYIFAAKKIDAKKDSEKCFNFVGSKTKSENNVETNKTKNSTGINLLILLSKKSNTSIVLFKLYSDTSNFVIKNPVITKKISTPTKPPENKKKSLF